MNLFVNISVCISSEQHVQSSPNVLMVLTTPWLGLPFNGVAIRYVFPVLRMAPCSLIMGPIDLCQYRCSYAAAASCTGPIFKTTKDLPKIVLSFFYKITLRSFENRAQANICAAWCQLTASCRRRKRLHAQQQQVRARDAGAKSAIHHCFVWYWTD